MQCVLAIGDSIANGHGDMVNAVQSQSYALWLAHAGGWCFKAYSTGGATSQRVLNEQLPRLGKHRFALIAISLGTNDLLTGMPIEAFENNMRQIVATASESADRLVVTNVPLSAARVPGARDRRKAAEQFNDVIARTSVECGAIAVDISKFSGPRQMRADRVHPNALGQLRIATLAATALQEEGVPMVPPARYTLGRPDTRLDPSVLINYGLGAPALVAKQSVKRLIGRG